MVAKKSSKKLVSRTKKKSKAVQLEVKPITSKQTKSQVLQAIADSTGLPRKQVKDVFITANRLLQSHMVKRGSGEFSFPEIPIKVLRKTKPATKKREGRNPMTGESITIAAKPKREVIKLRALKALKEAITA